MGSGEGTNVKILSTVKLLGATIIAVAIFYVGGMASMQALHYYGNFEWAITTASFWLGGLVMVVIVAECVKRIIVAVASVVEEEAAAPAVPPAADEEESRPAKPMARPVQAPPAQAPKPAAPQPPKPAAAPAAAQPQKK
jgi:hypothetical protein